jgi:hypothetical protein
MLRRRLGASLRRAAQKSVMEADADLEAYKKIEVELRPAGAPHTFSALHTTVVPRLFTRTA